MLHHQCEKLLYPLVAIYLAIIERMRKDFPVPAVPSINKFNGF